MEEAEAPRERERSMRAHGHTTVWGSHVGMSTPSAALDWLRRLQDWVSSRRVGNRGAADMAGYGTWDARRERFLPVRAESAFDHAVGQGGPTASLVLYNTMY